MNADMIDRRSMLRRALEVVCLIVIINAPFKSTAERTIVKHLEVALRNQVINIGRILAIGKSILFQRALIDPQVVDTNVEM